MAIVIYLDDLLEERESDSYPATSETIPAYQA